MNRRTKTIWIVIAIVLALGLAYLIYHRSTAEEKGGGGGRPVEVTVSTAPARGVTLTRSIEGVGDVLAAEAVTITAEAAGRVASIGFAEGADVGQGAVLVRLDAEQENAEVATRTAEAAELKGRLGRLQRLVGEGAIPRGDVADLTRNVEAANARIASARTVVEDTVIRAPFSGTIGLRQVSVGAFVQPGAELVTLDRIDSVKLRFAVPESALGRVRVGSAVEVRSPAFPDDVFPGRITAFASRLDPSLRTLTAEARLANPGRRLRPGMLGNVTVAAETVQTVVIPAIALQVRGPIQFVYRIVSGCAVRAEVRIGQREPDGVEIVSGLAAGALVATEGFDNLSSGTPVIDKRVTMQRARGRQGGGDEKSGKVGVGGGEGGGKAKGAEKSDEEKAREDDLRKRCRAIADQAGGSGRGADQAASPAASGGGASGGESGRRGG